MANRPARNREQRAESGGDLKPATLRNTTDGGPEQDTPILQTEVNHGPQVLLHMRWHSLPHAIVPSRPGHGPSARGAVVEGASIEAIELSSFPRATGCVNRRFYWMDESGPRPSYPVPVPGTQRIVATDPYGTVLLENGDWLKFDGTS